MRTSDTPQAPSPPRSLPQIPAALALAGLAASSCFLDPLNAVAFLVFVFVVAGIVLARKVPHAVLFLAFYTPFEPVVLNFVPEPLFFPARFGFYGLLAACTLGLVLRRLLETCRPWRFTPIDLPLLAFLAVSAASYLVNRPPLAAALYSYQAPLRFIIVGFYAVLLSDFTKGHTRLLLKGLFVIAFVQSCIGIAQSVFSDLLSPLLVPRGAALGEFVVGGFTQAAVWTSGYQVFATMGRYNALGLFLATVFVLSIPFYVQNRDQRRWFIALYAVMLPCIVLTAARAPFLFIFAGLMALGIAQRRWGLVSIPVVLLVALFGYVNLVPGAVKFVGYEDATALERALEMFDPLYLRVTSEWGRLYFVLRFPGAMLTLGLRRALLGFGPGTLGFRAAAIFGVTPLDELNRPATANEVIVDVNWAYILGQAGYLGLFAFVAMVAALAVFAARVRRNTDDPLLRPLSEGFLGVLAGHCVAGLTAPVWEWRSQALYFWLLAAVVVKLALDQKEQGAQVTGDTAAPGDGGT